MILNDPYNVNCASVLVPPKRVMLRYRINDMLLRNRSYKEPPVKRLPPSFIVYNSTSSRQGPPRSKSGGGIGSSDLLANRFHPANQPDMSTTVMCSRYPFTDMLTKLHARRELDRDRITDEKLIERPKKSEKTYGPQLFQQQLDPVHLEYRRQRRPQSAGCCMRQGGIF